MSACGECYGIGCYNGTVQIEEIVSILKTIRTCSKNSFDDKCNYVLFTDYRGGPETLPHLRWSSLFLDYMTMLFIGLVFL